MTSLSTRSILVIFSLKKNLTSNSSKPIWVLTNPNLFHDILRLPIGYSLPDFQPHRSKFLIHYAAAAAVTRCKGVDTKKKNRAHRTSGLVRIIPSGQDTCYLLFSQFRSPFDQLSRRRKNRSKMNFKPFYAHKCFDTPKFPRYQRIILEGLWSYQFVFWFVWPNMPETLTDFFFLCKKNWIEWCSHKTFDKKKFSAHIVKNTNESL